MTDPLPGSRQANAVGVGWHEILAKRAKRRLYYLNDYGHAVPRLRIETRRGGERCLWRERTVLWKMEQTKLYLEKCWGVS